MALFTVLGAEGYIGGRLAAHLRAEGHEVAAPPRGKPPARESGHVVYCVGVTADFRSRPFDTVAAHVSFLAEALAHIRPLSFLYLSSTRVYGGCDVGVETEPLRLRPDDPEDFYNATKIAGEALCLALPSDTIRVARLSNVFGLGMDAGARPREDFLSAVLREAAVGVVRLRTSLDSEKDYVAIEDAVRAIARIALRGRHRLYNVASGRNVRHGEVITRLADVAKCVVVERPGAPRVAYPQIDTARIAAEFESAERWAPSSPLGRLEELWRESCANAASRELAS